MTIRWKTLSVAGFKVGAAGRAKRLMSNVQREGFSMFVCFYEFAWIFFVISLSMLQVDHEQQHGRRGGRKNKTHRPFKFRVLQVDG